MTETLEGFEGNNCCEWEWEGSQQMRNGIEQEIAPHRMAAAEV